MESMSSLPGSPAGTPLHVASDERVNQQRDSSMFHSSQRRGDDSPRDSGVHEKISQFNTLASQSKQLERKTADAAIKRAMLGREAAEGELRQYKDETKHLRKQIDEGKERERRVGERLESVMESYRGAKETHAHTQALWEKEIRRARKESLKAQSSIIKLQEELKSARSALKSTEEMLDLEKTRSKTRKQEAFTARYAMVGVQEELEQTLERIKMLEQERDAFKALAKTEEDITRIAAEGRLPLPPAKEEDDEFASPKKSARVSSVNLDDVKTSQASEAEIEELTLLWQWEKQRAERAMEHIEFLTAECQLKCCTYAKTHARSKAATPASTRRRRPAPMKIADAGDLVILSEEAAGATPSGINSSPCSKKSKTDILREEEQVRASRRQSTIFVPTEGIFRTVSQEEAEAMEDVPVEGAAREQAVEDSATSPNQHPKSRFFARTPSIDPPAFAILNQPRTSLLSLLEAPHQHDQIMPPPAIFNVPTTPGPVVVVDIRTEMIDIRSDPVAEEPLQTNAPEENDNDEDTLTMRTPLAVVASNPNTYQSPEASPAARPNTAAAFYTTTTKVPIRDENADPSLASRLLAAQRTPSASSSKSIDAQPPSFDPTNPALTPTMTREQALAQIRERRGRARSAAEAGKQGGAAMPVTPRRQMVEGLERRDVSAPAGRVGGTRVVSAGRRARS